MCLSKHMKTGVVGMIMVAAVLGRVFGAGGDAKVRPAQCAGTWYPGSPAGLTKEIDELLTKAVVTTLPGKPIAVISPHAGYRYSAPVAATGYRCLQGHEYKRIIVMAFSHRAAGMYKGVDVPRELTAYQTPLGEIPIDRAVCDALLKSPLFVSKPEIDQGEHSLELQLPLLQRTVKDFKLVPLLVGRMETQDYAQAAAAIQPWVDKDTLLVASSDFTHFGPNFGYVPFSDDVPTRLGRLADDAAGPILQCDFDGFAAHLANTQDTICGRGPIGLLLRILSMDEGASGVRAGLDTSGRMTGDYENSVTYQSIVFTRRPGTLEAREREELLKLARQTVTAYLGGQPLPEVKVEQLPAALRENGACFVTLENHGRLRGCIGNMTAEGPLYKAVMRNAVSACQDYRFANEPVAAGELGEIDIEISYLTPMKRIDKTESVIVGRHGLMMAMGGHRGVLLPQVAARRGWTREEFLGETCRKAGLPLDAWKQPAMEIYSFEAEVFGEAKPK